MTPNQPGIPEIDPPSPGGPENDPPASRGGRKRPPPLPDSKKHPSGKSQTWKKWTSGNPIFGGDPSTRDSTGKMSHFWGGLVTLDLIF